MFASGKTAAVASAANYIEDVFSTYLYTGNGTSQTITNGIDLSTKGGLLWIKRRGIASGQNTLVDSETGSNGRYYLSSNLTDGLTDTGSSNLPFNTSGFSLNSGSNQWNGSSANTYASWTFRKQPKFFDVVTYTGNGTSQNIAHSLGSVPGCIIVKATSFASNWMVYHTSLANTEALFLNLTNAKATGSSAWNSTTPTSTVFSVGANSNVNASGESYVAYLFAHNAGGFGLTGTDNVISCGSVTLNSSGAGTVNLGYEPQWVLMKTSSSANDWIIFDTMRGFSVTGGSGYKTLNPNLSAAEFSGSSTYFQLTNTGFSINMNFAGWQNENLIYMTIRRGPMKVPTSGTSVFYSAGFSDNSSSFSTGFVTDFAINKVNYYNPDAGLYTTGSNYMTPRLVGTNPLQTNSTAAEGGGTYPAGWDIQDGYKWANGSGYDIFGWAFARAPSFADVVCYTGTGSATTFTHNLGIAPELMIVKNRSSAGYGWLTYSATLGATKYLQLNSTAAEGTVSTYWNNTAPTSSVFSVGTAGATNASGDTFVAYLFATCAGVSKVGSYSGTGSTQTIDCGFASGARFVLIKRTNTTGAWFVYDSSRGIQSGNDPYLLWNDSAAAVTSTNYVDSASTGFQVIGNGLNASGSTYIFLAIA